MPKTITLRVADEVYGRLAAAAKAERRPLANLIETLALRKLDEDIFADLIEMDEIMGFNTPGDFLKVIFKKLESISVA